MPIEIGGLLTFLPRQEYQLHGEVWQSGFGQIRNPKSAIRNCFRWLLRLERQK
jgi:hypothetical protein